MTLSQEQLEAPDSTQRPSRHAVIMRGVVAPILGLLAVATIILGVLNATIWRPDPHVDASASVNSSPYIVTDPGVLQLIDEHTRLTATTSGSGQVCIALGSAKDVAGWIAGQPYTRITGLRSWTELSTRSMKAQGSANAGDTGDAAVPIEQSDMWSNVACGSTSATINTDASHDSDVALIDVGKDAGEASIAMHAVRQKMPDFAMPLYFVGGLLIVLTVLAASVFAMPSHKRRKRHIASRPVEVNNDEVAIAEAFTGSFRGLTSAVRIRPKDGSRHKRHATVSGERAAATGATASAPVVIDPSERNLVADVQGANAHAGDTGGTPSVVPPTDAASAGTQSSPQSSPQSHQGTGEAAADAGTATDAAQPGDGTQADNDAQTTVISPDELQAYFARLSQEIAADDAGHAETDDHAEHQGGEQ